MGDAREGTARAPLSHRATFATYKPTMNRAAHRSVAVSPSTLASSYVRLNVGGSLFLTTIETLTRQDSMLRAMFSGRLEVMCDEEGYILLDRSGRHFELILAYLRDGSAVLPEHDRQQVEEILAEAKFYCIQGLIDDCQRVLASDFRKDESVPVCRIPLITGRKQERALLAVSELPVIKLLLNRHNNKYSYTNQSDDNLLKNLELFEKLVARFNERILFIKDVGAADEVCSWSFYGNQKKIAEVCCTSIVYAPDKKQTKVEFPEARIYEEAMNILLYEPSQRQRLGSPSHQSAAHRHSSGSMKGNSATGATSPTGDQPSTSEYVHSSGDELARGSSAPPSPTPEHLAERTRQNMGYSSLSCYWMLADKLALARRELNK